MERGRLVRLRPERLAPGLFALVPPHFTKP